MSSLFSAIDFVSGMKEYIYRGFQQLPLVLIGVSFLFTATTGSVAFFYIFIGLTSFVPILTYILQALFGFLGRKIPGASASFTRSDVCGLVPPEGRALNLYTPKGGVTPIPSFWLMEIMFLFGFLFSNAIESLQASGNCPESDAAERKKYHASYVVAMLSVLFILIIGIRLRYQASCELSSISFLGILFLLFSASAAGGLGTGMYMFARKCGARTGDLLGILSQFLPPSAYAQAPVVCTSE